MKALIQRVTYARVTIDGKETREIGPGLLAQIGGAADDSLELCGKLAKKTANLRIFDDAEGKLNLSALDKGYSVMVVSQFTLLADSSRGNRPSFIGAAKPPLSVDAYEEFVRELRGYPFRSIRTGEFGAEMQVEFCNDGPITVMLDTKEW